MFTKIDRAGRSRWRSRGACVLVAALVAGGCERSGGSGTSATPSSSPSASTTTPDNPSTVVGKSAKMARDTGSLIGGAQASELAAAEAITGEAHLVKAAGVTFTVLSTWTKQPAQGGTTMAPLAEFTFEGAGGPARLAFFSTGGSVEANLARWKGQVTDAGKPAEAKVQTANRAGLAVTTVQLAGDYTPGMNRPMQPDQMFLGGIVVAPRGQVQVKLTGPIDTVKDLVPQFEAMMAGVSAD